MKTPPELFGKRSITDAVLKLIGKSAPGTNSKKSILHIVRKILGYFKSAPTGKIGIYGVDGIGKTTVLKALMDCQETKTLFDSAIYVCITRYWSRRKVQNAIARQLSLDWSNSETDDEIAEKLVTFLKSRNFLLLLDDVWEHIDLDSIGVPFKNLKNGSKIVLAAQEVDVCNSMDVCKVTKMENLSSEEAWTLFRDQVGGALDSPKIESIARDIVKECGGLPINLVVTGKAFRKQINPIVLNLTLQDFQSHDGKDSQAKLRRQLKFSYDSLKGPVIKSCFLYTALYQEGHEIKVSGLIKHWIQEELITGHLADVNKKGQQIVEDLVDASLLESSDDGFFVTMHRVIRDLALSIISTNPENCQFLAKMGVVVTSEGKEGLSTRKYQVLSRSFAELTEPPPEKEWKGMEMIFLMGNCFSRLPEKPSCPQLAILSLEGNIKLTKIPDSFFEGIPNLQALNLSNTRIMSLPTSFFRLRKLLALTLRDCPLFVDLLPEIGDLEHLESLDLQGTEINGLPDEVGQLCFLKLLRVSFYGSIDCSKEVQLSSALLSHETITRLIMLKELSIVVRMGDPRWNKVVESVTEEVTYLKDLTNLHFYFPDADILEFYIRRSASWTLNSLSKFKFVVGHNITHIVSEVPKQEEFEYEKEDRCLRYLNGDTVPDAIVRVLSRANAFYLDNHFTVNSLSEFGVEVLKELRFCIVSECPNIHVLIDDKDETESIFPFLERLSIHCLWNLRGICEDTVSQGSFNRLRFLSVQKCPKLMHVLTETLVYNLSNLEELVVEDCSAVKEIVKLELDSDDEFGVLLPKLRKLAVRDLPELVSIGNRSWPSLEQLSICHCPKLKNLIDFRSADSMKEIRGERGWWDALYWEESALHSKFQSRFTAVIHCDS